jgi:hypothetical protein
MRSLYDRWGLAVRLTDERLAHVLDHPEMVEMEPAIVRTLEEPESVVRSASDEQVRLYYHFYRDTAVGEKFVCVVVKVLEEDAFVITAYLTDKIKQGELVWPTEER